MTKIFRYKMTTDIGMAPCIDRGLVTLATCKPSVRARAGPGDWVAGFRSVANGVPSGMLIWAGRVAHIFSDVGGYERQHRGRSDAIYRKLPDGRFKRLRPDYHPGASEFRKDTTHPVVVFEQGAAWYFGREPHMLPDQLIHLAPKLRDRNFLVNRARFGDAAALEQWLRSVSEPGVHGKPRDGNPFKIIRCSSPARSVDKIGWASSRGHWLRLHSCSSA